MRSREELKESLGDSTDTEYSLELLGTILLDIRDLLIDLYNRDADVRIEVPE